MSYSPFPSAGPDEMAIPAPRILPPSNENDLSGAISDIVQSIQRELGEAKEDPDAPAWSRSILRAANSLFDKISTSSTTVPPGVVDSRPPVPQRRLEARPPGALSQAFLSRHSSRDRAPARIPATLRKSSSISGRSLHAFVLQKSPLKP